jgi:acetolactate synthase-1/2/3 large subunit
VSGPLTPEALSAAIAAELPEGAIVMDEGNTSTGPFFRFSAGGPSHSYLNLTGGAIGIGLPCATGAALACPERRVIALEADGSAMYTLQALWTQAREGLNVTTVLCANRSYRIVGIELERAGTSARGPQTDALIDLSRPAIDWVSLAQGLGVPAVRVATAEDLSRELKTRLYEAGPALIEAVL